ncbi:unnamed protein product [Wuchereria bancrofti]|uniref:Uncharacterized protein n=1 Tax=Wuchereria bancrofti TaxID=6293 RepID=A0A183XNN4_WUCBA|nr:unnamed protein product [Wuchereria bancrofti]
MAKLTDENGEKRYVKKVNGNDFEKNNKRKANLSEEESSDDAINPNYTSSVFLFRKISNIQHIINSVFVQVLFSSFSVAAIATNGSDRLYGGPFTTIAYSLGNRVALVAGVMLCLANCGFTGICLTICAQLIQQYILKPRPIKPHLAKLAFENNHKAIRELYEKPYYMHLTLLVAFLILITPFNAFGKRILKWICWIPFTVFVILLVGIFVSASSKIIQRDVEPRCIHEPMELIPKDRYHDQVPVLLYLPTNYTTVPPINAIIDPSIMKHFCE